MLGSTNISSQIQRSFSDMSQQATLSPSPILFHRAPPSSSFPGYNSPSAPHENIPGTVAQRRTPHPHNPPVQSFHRPTGDMPERPRSQLRPQLEHRASQTLTIDLTDEHDEAPVASQNSSQSQRPPRLGRSDAIEMADVIDLTSDNDVEITGVTARQLPLPRPGVARPPPPQRFPRRFASPSLFVPQDPPTRHFNRLFSQDGPFGAGIHIRSEQGQIIIRNRPDFIEHIQMLANAQAMPGQMDYQHGAFADRKPDHVPPPPAKEGFTRSPVETDVVICPSCEDELIHNKDTDEPMVKKGGKAPTRKEREEHPFWVVKECGHVRSSLSVFRCAFTNLGLGLLQSLLSEPCAI